MQFLEIIPGFVLIIAGLLSLAISIIWLIFPFLVCSRLDKIHRELQLIELSTKKATPDAVTPYRAPVVAISKAERDAAWRAAQSAE